MVRCVRHPMCLAVITVGIGGLLIYYTWAMLVFAITMFGLTIRARGEEQALASKFGATREVYCRRVPVSLPCGTRQ